jgi:hypothetical protein
MRNGITARERSARSGLILHMIKKVPKRVRSDPKIVAKPRLK